MDSQRFQRIERLFEEAQTLDGANRLEWLARECADDPTLIDEVTELLALDGPQVINDSFRSGVMEFHRDTAPEAARAGPYKLSHLLGRGGMGAVYLGIRDDGQYDDEVAVKLVSAGPGMSGFLDRFKRERQALARLKHPNIARLLDSGFADNGASYIVMELVDGPPLDVYCESKSLSVRETIALVLQICNGVAHAHRHLIVHRDLKPGNVLVDATGTPKILDFGICKVLEDQAGGEATIDAPFFTPEYCSPEQVTGEPVTAVSDEYSLGAMLYALLTGKKAHAIDKFTIPAIATAVCEVPVIRPSIAAADRSRAKQLEGDIDLVLGKALQKDPERRYPSVEAFAADLQRILNNEPVEARPESTLYHIRKFVDRHRLPVLAAAIAVIALIGGTIAYARQARLARQQSTEARRLANAMIFEIHDKIRDLQGSLPAKEAIVKLGLDYLDRMSAQASGDAVLRRELGEAYLRMGEVMADFNGTQKGDLQGAIAAYRKGLTAIETLSDDLETGILRLNLWKGLGSAQVRQDQQVARRTFDQADRLATSLLQTHPDSDGLLQAVGSVESGFVTLLRDRDEFDEAIIRNTRATEAHKKYLARHPGDIATLADLASAYSVAGAIQYRINDHLSARANLQAAVTQWDEIIQKQPNSRPFQRNRMLAYSHLGDELASPEALDLKGATAAYETMVAIARQGYDANPSDQNATIDLGMALGAQSSLPGSMPERAVELLRDTVKYIGEAQRRDPANVSVRANLAVFYVRLSDKLRLLKKDDEARLWLSTGWVLVEGEKKEFSQLFRARTVLAWRLANDSADRGDYNKALTYARRSISEAERAGGKEKTDAIAAVTKLAANPKLPAAIASEIAALVR